MNSTNLTVECPVCKKQLSEYAFTTNGTYVAIVCDQCGYEFYRKAPKYIPQAGDFVQPDAWNDGEKLESDDGYRDSSFPGCQFRIPAHGYKLAVNIHVTGRPQRKNYIRLYRSRCKIEWVQDGEPSTFSGGYIYHN